MPLWLKQSLVPTLILAAMLLTLGVLAWLQHGWSAQVGEALEQRMRAGLAASVRQFQAALQQDLGRLCNSFEVGTATSTDEMKTRLVENAREWTRRGTARELVGSVYMVRNDARGDWRVEKLDPAAGRYIPLPWPSTWSGIAEELSTNADDLDHATPRQWIRRPWILDLDQMLLFRAVAVESTVADQSDPLRYRLLAYVLVSLDRRFVENQYLPQLVDRHFRPGEPDYRVAILKTGDHPTTLYDSQPEAGQPLAAAGDEALDLLAPAAAADSGQRLLNIREADDAVGLRLVAQHRPGALDAAVTRLRRRNLAVSFGVLLILCAGMAFLAITAQRAQQLARLQVAFVAGFSHELRTPIAAVCTMAENMADGVVSSEQQIRKYGSLLQAQGRRLRSMVEGVLFFAAHEKRRPTLDLRPVQLREVLASALSDEYPLMEATGMRVEEHLSANLPLILADSAALRTCIGNLLSNAAKYGKAGGWIGIRAEEVQGERGAAEVRFTVQDRGPGIDAADRRHIFEPFYRGAKAREAQLPGTGLGLSLVRQMMEAMSGRVSVGTEQGGGASFTLHLTAAAVEVKQS